MAIKRRKVDAWEWVCTCERCGHEWTSLATEPPRACASCKARNWNKPARKYERKSKG